MIHDFSTKALNYLDERTHLRPRRKPIGPSSVITDHGTYTTPVIENKSKTFFIGGATIVVFLTPVAVITNEFLKGKKTKRHEPNVTKSRTSLSQSSTKHSNRTEAALESSVPSTVPKRHAEPLPSNVTNLTSTALDSTIGGLSTFFGN